MFLGGKGTPDEQRKWECTATWLKKNQGKEYSVFSGSSGISSGKSRYGGRVVGNEDGGREIRAKGEKTVWGKRAKGNEYEESGNLVRYKTTLGY